jgi:tetratricopeptide (TPR) repeat protein
MLYHYDTPSIKPLVLMITDRIDVFLSRKSQDAHLAKEVYDFLTSKGLQVFDSDHSLLEMGNSDYSRAIDDALVKTNHLIVIGSSVENITSSWVEAEWRFFLNRKRANKTKGNILTVVTKTVAIDDLPPSLQNYEVIPFEQKNTKILPYVMVGHIKEVVVEKNVIEPVVNNPPKTIDYSSLSDTELVKKANEGIAEAQTLLGYRYDRIGDYSMALKWYLKAAKQGNAIAQCNIGSLYHKGQDMISFLFSQGVNQDYKQAMQWYVKAAEQENTDAQNNIGLLYYNGQGVKKDREIAKEWFLKAAKQGNELAKEWLRQLYNITNY